MSDERHDVVGIDARLEHEAAATRVGGWQINRHIAETPRERDDAQLRRD